jgi:hypothetical protein
LAGGGALSVAIFSGEATPANRLSARRLSAG